MEVSAPKEKGIIQSAEQPIQDLHQAVSDRLNRAGHRVTPQSVNPEGESPLKRIEEMAGDTTHVVGSSFGEMVSGKGGTTHVRTTGGKVPISINVARALKRRILEKAA